MKLKNDLPLFVRTTRVLSGTRRVAITLLVMMLTMTAQTVWADVDDEFTVDYVKYKVTSESPNEVQIIGYEAGVPANLVIPDKVSDYSVTSIGESAFEDCFGLTSIIIPNSVTSIGESAFYDCSGLTSIIIPNRVTSIGKNAFEGCSGLTSITIPNSVTSISNGIFSGCTSLAAITVDAGNTVYDSRDNCNAIITTATNALISGCKNTTIPNSVTSIGESAFQNCSGLTSFTIPASVTSIGDDAFGACTALTSVTFIENSQLTSIGDAAFYNTGLISFTIPASVTSIGDEAFGACTALTSVTFIENSQLTSIGDAAFYNTGLISFTIPASVTSIGDGAFERCTSLTTITIPASVTSIGNGAFRDCSHLEAINVDGSNLYYSSDGGVLFNKNKTTIITYPKSKSGTSYDIPASVTTISDYAFEDCVTLTSITIPTGVTTIGKNTFAGCSELTAIIIPFGVTTIGGSAFWQCSHLTSVTIPASVTTIYNYAFSDCSRLTTVTIGSGVTSIGQDAFWGCTSVTDVYCYADPANLTWDEMGRDDFITTTTDANFPTKCHVFDASAWSGFTDVNVTFVGDLLTLTSGNCGTTGSENSVTWIYDLPSKTLSISGTGQMMYYGSALGGDSQYHSTAPWSKYDSEIQKVIVESDVTYVGSYAFAYCSALRSVSLPATVIQMGDYVCYSSNIERIDIPCETDAVTIGTGGFTSCPADLVIAVPSTLLGTYQGAANWSTYAANLVGMLSETTGFGTADFATGKYEFKRIFKCGVASTLCLPFNVCLEQAVTIGKFYEFVGIDKSNSEWAVIMQESPSSNVVAGDLDANKPYLFVPYIFDGKSQGDPVEFTFSGIADPASASYVSWTEDAVTGSYWTFQGVYYNLSWLDGNSDLGKVYGFAANTYDGGSYTVNPGDFVRAAAGASIVPFRAYLQYNQGASGARRVTSGEAEELPAKMTVRLVSADGSSVNIGTIDTRTGEMSLNNDWYTLDGRRLSSKPAQKGLYIHDGRKVVVK